MPNISNIVDLFERFAVAPIDVMPQQCVVVRNRNVKCRRCAEACTSEAIFIQNNELMVEPEKCIGCGTCAAVCPTGVYRAQKPGEAELMQRCIRSLELNEGRVIISCSTLLEAAKGLFQSDKVAEVRCLGRVNESLMSLLAQQGADEIVLVRGNCEECAQSNGYEVVQQAVETTNELFDVWNVPCQAKLTSKLPSSLKHKGKRSYDETRRGFFTGLRGEAKNVAATTASYALDEALNTESEKKKKTLIKVGKGGVLPQFMPLQRRYLLEALDSFGEPHDEMIETRLWGQVDIDKDACNACRLCATFCPTGALQKFKEEDEEGEVLFGVDHFARICVQCGSCADICMKNAMTLSPIVSTSDISSGEPRRFLMEESKDESFINKLKRQPAPKKKD